MITCCFTAVSDTTYRRRHGCNRFAIYEKKGKNTLADARFRALRDLIGRTNPKNSEIMKSIRLFIGAVGLVISALALHSCNDNEYYDYGYLRPTALVTVRPQADGTFCMQLDDFSVLYPENMSESPFGDKEVRALVNYTVNASDKDTRTVYANVHVNWIDSIRTKMPVADLGEENNVVEYGNDPIEIVRDWVTVAEDGYLTLRIRTRWGQRCTPHVINLVGGVNPENPYEFDLHHDANGDEYGEMGDALIAFNLNDLPRSEGDRVTIKLNWRSFSGYKNTEFTLRLRPADGDTGGVDGDGDTGDDTGSGELDPASVAYSRYVE